MVLFNVDSNINLIQLYNMLTVTVIEQSAQNRRCDKGHVSFSEIAAKVGANDYQNLIEWVTEISSEMNLNVTTKHLTRTYFDLTISTCQDALFLSYLPLMLACLSLSIKFNELRQVSERITPAFLFNQAQLQFSNESYFLYECKILNALRFRVKYTTPYDYIDPFCSKFPWMPKIRQVLPIYLQLALTHPLSCQYSSEQVFFGSVLAIIRSKPVNLSNIQTRVLQGMTDTWKNANEIGQLLMQAVEFYSQPTQQY